MHFGTRSVFEIAPWHVSEPGRPSEAAGTADSIFSLANEYMGCRGTFEEGSSGDSFEGCYINGIYGRQPVTYVWKRKGFPDLANSMIHTTNWLRTRIRLAGQPFSMSSLPYTRYERQLDMSQGLLRRSVDICLSDDTTVRLEFERFVSHADRHLAALRVSVQLSAPNPIPIELELSLDATRENAHSNRSGRHSRTLRKQCEERGATLLRKVETTGQYYIHRMHLVVPKDAQLLTSPEAHEDETSVRLCFEAIPGRSYVFDKMVSVWTSRDLGYPFGLIQKGQDVVDIPEEKAIIEELVKRGAEHSATVARLGYDAARAEHAHTVAKTWQDLDVQIEGDAAAQQGIRYCLFQLFNTYRGHDEHLNIGAKGMTGETYDGRYFWDSEAYCLPFYLLTNHNAAENLLKYRHNTLDAARQRAKELDHDGACYPLQTIDGTEDSGVWEYSLGEVHINAIMVYAVYLYTKTSGDRAYLHNQGIDVAVGVSRYYASRVSYVPNRRGYGILKCMGPDEFQQVVDNNYYTNYMARWCLDYTIDCLEHMRRETPELWEAARERWDLGDGELDWWREISSRMILTYDERAKVMVQDDSFLSLDPISREELDRDRDIPVAGKWTIEKIQKSALLKQPDVLMLPFLFPEKFSREEKKANYQFYEQRTIHNSSLSPCIHSIIATEIGRHHQAYEYYLWASRLDLDDFNNNTREGLHISSMAGTWMNILFGYAGLRIGEQQLELCPRLPSQWGALTFRLKYRGCGLEFTVNRETIVVRVVSGESPAPVVLYGSPLQLDAQREASCQVPEGWYQQSQLALVVLDTQCAPEATLSALRKECEDQSIAIEVASEWRAGLKACDKHGLNKSQCVSISTDPEWISAAAKQGMKTMGIGDKYELANADYVLCSPQYLTLERLRMLF